jgi:hypothetical protein
MHLGADVVGDDTHDALAVLPRQSLPGVAETPGQAVDPQPIELNTKIRRRNLKLGRLSDSCRSPVQWLWPDRIARKVVLVTSPISFTCALSKARSCCRLKLLGWPFSSCIPSRK